MSVPTPGSRTSHYDYALPDTLIAQHPVEPRDASRMLVVDRAAGTLAHRTFRDIADLIPAGDALVVNTTRVFRARLIGHRDTGGQAEVFLLRPLDDEHYEAMVHPGAKLRPGKFVTVVPGFRVEIVETTPRHTRIVRLHTEGESASVAIERHGHIPLPPYIGRADEVVDETRYQTVYAAQSGSVAAPTAGLHFTPELLSRLEARGVVRHDVLLHVGAGTFKPVQDEDPSAHLMHEEWSEITPETAAALNATRARGGTIWAVGTTSTRALESATDESGLVQPMSRETNLFVRPPYRFRGVDHLVTNFHLPKSTLVMLVAAFAGYELTMHAYRTAVEEQYRFFSYGDAMCIL
ncbi:MAG TPA: tRNA preQ1(34) S-adenosylmethionine ribosyltransferase-isomerase QueA [Gemmatimonas sp.]|nr:tRNA preQ1(34) S-adenosylmethionine ribosyltransferase-isomerase QueA [Gemmatimonas sp.]